ncbi:hypothetical protein ACJIZ3_002719 [Penstemon smallii]|uniref:Uncharacterized protein n=1 Tax=Penstemon smallii TaxID=265156 RepID=A0ABD3U7A2_9LAMI
MRGGERGGTGSGAVAGAVWPHD